MKHNGVYHAILATCGHSQVIGIDYSINYSPVMNDITFWVMLLIMIHFGLLAKTLNVETAFLYAEFEEEIYLVCPPSTKGIGKGD